MRVAGLLLVLGCVLVAAPAAEAAGAPELLDQPGYLIGTRSRASDDSQVLDRVRRLGLRDGRVKADVNVLQRVDPSYSRRPLDHIEIVVRCGSVLWIVRETFVDSLDGFGSDVVNRVYRVSAADSLQLTEAPFGIPGFSVRELQCDSDRSGAVYLEHSGDDGDDVILRVRPDGTFEQVDDRGRDGAFTVTLFGITFHLRHGRAALVGRDGGRRVIRPGNRHGWGRSELVPVGRGLRIVEHVNGPAWLRRFAQRSRGRRVAGLRVDALGTFCGGLVLTRVITLSSTELVFRRGGRVVRRLRSETSPGIIDPARGTIVLLGRVYSACGAKAGRLVTRLSTGSASDAIGVTDSS
jgi:hypothetical protein